jgi:hypothetical protein
MTRAEFDSMTFEEVLEWANENVNDLTTEDILIDFAKTKIDDDNIFMAIHILGAIHNNPYDTEHYLYDYCMGTLETPTPVTCKEDFEDYIDFDDEEDIEEVDIDSYRCSTTSRLF